MHKLYLFYKCSWYHDSSVSAPNHLRPLVDGPLFLSKNPSLTSSGKITKASEPKLKVIFSSLEEKQRHQQTVPSTKKGAVRKPQAQVTSELGRVQSYQSLSQRHSLAFFFSCMEKRAI